MKKIFTLLFLFQAFTSMSQPYYSCVDSTAIEPYYQCGRYAGGDIFKPVCGCDNITYRNECAAIHWGGLVNWIPETVCGNFSFDFRPTALSYQSAENYPARFQAFLKNPNHVNVGIALYIYDDFGKLWYSWNSSTGNDGLFPLEPKELPLQTLKQGIYIMIVVVNNEKQTLKFCKLTNDD